MEDCEASCSNRRSWPPEWVASCQHVFDTGTDKDVQHLPCGMKASVKTTHEAKHCSRWQNSEMYGSDSQQLPSPFAALPKATPETKECSQPRDSDVHVQLCSMQEELRSRLSDLDRKLDDLSMAMCGSLDGVSVDVSKLNETCTRLSQHCRLKSVGNAAQLTAVTERPRGRKSRIVEQCVVETGVFENDSYLSRPGLDDMECTDGPDSPDDWSRQRSLRSLRSGGGGSDKGMRASATLSESVAILRRMGGEMSVAQAVWTFLEDPDSTIFALWYQKVRAQIIMMSTIATLLMTLHPAPLPVSFLYAFNVILDVVFMMETSIRFGVCRSTRLFLKSPNNIIDIIGSLFPLLVNLPCLFIGVDDCTAEGSALQTIRTCVPVLRLLKALRHFKQFHLFLCLAEDIQEALGVLMLILGIIVLSCASIVYLVEPRDNIETFPIAMYFIVTTVSTVGYGDFSPTTTVGYAVVSAVILISILFMALPLGIIGNAFTNIWQERDKVLLTLRTQERLEQWGYTAEDMKKLLKHFDTNGDGVLDLVEFLSMIREMRIGIDRSRVVALFEMFDKDGSGTINAKELCRALFPASYHDIAQDAMGVGIGGIMSGLFRQTSPSSNGSDPR